MLLFLWRPTGWRCLGEKIGLLWKSYETYEYTLRWVIPVVCILYKSYYVLSSQNTTVFRKRYMEYLYYQLHVSASTLAIIRLALNLSRYYTICMVCSGGGGGREGGTSSRLPQTNKLVVIVNIYRHCTQIQRKPQTLLITEPRVNRMWSARNAGNSPKLTLGPRQEWNCLKHIWGWSIA
jgi:hypothetical protein